MGESVTLDAMFRELSEASSVLLVTHLRPDGDALGSTFGMRAYLRAQGKRADVLLTDGMPHRYLRLYPGALSKMTRNQADEYELVAILDCANIARLNIGDALDIDYLRARRTISIDHHVYNNLDAPKNFVCPEHSSASEIAACTRTLSSASSRALTSATTASGADSPMRPSSVAAERRTSEPEEFMKP